MKIIEFNDLEVVISIRNDEIVLFKDYIIRLSNKIQSNISESDLNLARDYCKKFLIDNIIMIINNYGLSYLPEKVYDSCKLPYK